MTMTLQQAPRSGATVTKSAPARPAAKHPRRVKFPPKCGLFGGVMMTPTTYAEAVEALVSAAAARQPAAADFAAVHVLAMAASDPAVRAKITAMARVAPDGQPVRW